MRIAVTSTGEAPDATLDPRFGRAARFLIFDRDDDVCEVVDNAVNVAAAQGAGVQAAETVVRAGAQVLITGHCGPKAFRALSAAGVTVYTTDAWTVREALGQFRAGTLALAGGADVAGHWTQP